MLALTRALRSTAKLTPSAFAPALGVGNFLLRSRSLCSPSTQNVGLNENTEAHVDADAAEKRGFQLKAKEVAISPKKLTLLANQIAGLSLSEAYAQMALSEKRIAATRIKQLLDSAWYVGEAHHNLDPQKLVIREAWISKDKYLFRRMYHSKGRLGIKTRPKTTLTIRLEEEDVVTNRRGEQRHGKYSGLMKHHWKSWKGKLHGMPKGDSE